MCLSLGWKATDLYPCASKVKNGRHKKKQILRSAKLDKNGKSQMSRGSSADLTIYLKV